MPRLENWSIVGTDPYLPPERQRQDLTGEVFDHPNKRFTDGKRIYTSRIIGRTTGDRIITASGNQYELGEVDPEYEKAFPNARSRLLKTLIVITENVD